MLFSVVAGLLVLVLIWLVVGPNGIGLKGLALKLLMGFQVLNRVLLRLRGLTPDDVAAERVVSGKSWDEFCDTLKAAGATVMFPGTPDTAFDKAEGYRYLSRLVRAGLENFLEGADPEAPQLVSIVDGLRAAPCKLGNDNPDNLYQNATISSEYSYRVTGTRGTVRYLGFGTQAGQYGKPGGLRTVDYKEASELTLGEDGTIELYLGVERPANAVNWLRLESSIKEGLFIVRQTFHNRDGEDPAALTIRRVGGSDVLQPRPLTPAGLDAGLAQAGLFVTGASLMFANWARGFKKHTNQLPLFDQNKSNQAGGDPNIRYFHSYWELQEGEALVVTATPPRCQYWNFVLHNHWMESLDHRYYQVFANMYRCPKRSDGSLRLIVAHSNPNSTKDLGYWLDTAGHSCGTMAFRWVRPHPEDDHENLPMPSCKVVRFDDLASLEEQ